MSGIPIPSVETIKKWIGYWRKFRGKRVKIFLKSGTKSRMDFGYGEDSQPFILDLRNYDIKSTYEKQHLDVLFGTIEDVVESPFGVWLKDVSVSDETDIERVFIPMSEITRIYFFRKQKG
jgi:hypothetical protein